MQTGVIRGRVLQWALCGCLAWARVDAGGAEYRFADSFESALRSEVFEVDSFELGDGTRLVTGDFNLEGSELVANLAVLRVDGSFGSAFEAPPVGRLVVTDAARLANGRYLVGGSARSTKNGSESSAPFLLEYDSAGRLLRTVSLGDWNWDAAEIAADGKLLVVEGWDANPNTPVYLRRKTLTAGGALQGDSSFLQVAFGGDLHKLGLLKDGSILALGEFTSVNGSSTTGQAVKLSPNGAVVSEFKTSATAGQGLALYGSRVFSMSNGDVMVMLGSYERPVIRFLANGSIDSAFSMAWLDQMPYAARIAEAPGGKYYMLNGPYGASRAPLVRMNRNGSLDTSFSLSLAPALSEHSVTYGIALADGRIALRYYDSEKPACGWQMVSPSGAGSQLAAPDFGRSARMRARWLESGELLARSDSAVLRDPETGEVALNAAVVLRADGTARLFAPSGSGLSGEDIPFVLDDGSFLLPNFQKYDWQGQPLDSNPATQASILAPVLGGGWIVRGLSLPGQGATTFAKLRADGAVDPAFSPYTAGFQVAAAADHSANGLVFLAELGGNTPGYKLHRLAPDGSPDGSFSSPEFTALQVGQVQATPNGIYVFGSELRVNGTLKLLGARFHWNGGFDASYAPEAAVTASFGQPLAESGSRRFAEDGSSVHVGYPANASPPLGRAYVYAVSPAGVATRINGDETWASAWIDVSAEGDAVVSGEALVAGFVLGDASAVYTRSPLPHSTPRTAVAIAQGLLESIEIGLADAEGATLQWMKNGSPIPGANSRALGFPAMSLADAGSYRLAVEKGGATQLSRAIELVAPIMPEVASHPQDQFVRLGGSVTFTAGFASQVGTSLQWFRDNQPIAGAIGSALTIEDFQSEDLGSYRLRARNALGEAWTDAAGARISGYVATSYPSLEYDAFLSGPVVQTIAAREDGGFWLQRGSGIDNYSVFTSQGQLVENVLTSLPSETTRVYPLYDGRVIVQRFDGGSFRFRRYGSDGARDESYGEPTIPHRGYFPLLEPVVGRLRLMSQVEESYAIGSDGSVSPFTLHADMSVLGIHYATPALDNGAFISFDGLSGAITRTLEDGRLDASFAPIAKTDPQPLAFWPDGTALVRSEAGLAARAPSGPLAWSKAWDPVAIEARLSSTPGSQRMFVVGSDEVNGLRLYWVGKDGIGLDQSWPAPVFEGVRAWAAIADRRVVFSGEHDSAELGGRVSTVAIVDVDTGEVAMTPLLSRTPAALDDSVALAADGGVFVSGRFAEVGGVARAGLAKIGPNGALDEGFEANESAVPHFGTIESLHSQAEGGLLVIAHHPNTPEKGDCFTLLGLDGEGAERFAMERCGGVFWRVADYDGGRFMLMERLADGSFVLRRHLSGGLVDASFASRAYPSGLYQIEMEVMPSGAMLVYWLDAGGTHIDRLKPDGSKDFSFAWDVSGPQLSKIRSNAQGEVYALTNDAFHRVARLESDGSLDTGFVPQLDQPIHPQDLFFLSDGSILLPEPAPILLRPDGSVSDKISGVAIGWGASLIGVRDGRAIVFHPGAKLMVVAANVEFPTARSVPRSVVARAGGPAELRVDFDPLVGASYQWHRDGQALLGQTSPILRIASVDPGDVGGYTLVVSVDGKELSLPALSLALGSPPELPRMQSFATDEGVAFHWIESEGATALPMSSPDLETWQLGHPQIRFGVNGLRTIIANPAESVYLRLIETNE